MESRYDLLRRWLSSLFRRRLRIPALVELTLTMGR